MSATDGRTCGSCSLCCKVYDVPVLDKMAGVWCSHYQTGKGCSIHETRPDFCRSFFCNWIYQTELGPEWKPDRARFVLTTDPTTKNVLVEVDPGLPNAWRKEPYYSAMKRWTTILIQQKRHVVISVRKVLTILLPDEDIAIGALADDEMLYFTKKQMGDGKIHVTVTKGKKPSTSL